MLVGHEILSHLYVICIEKAGTCGPLMTQIIAKRKKTFKKEGYKRVAEAI